jgi:hypothetical protein
VSRFKKARTFAISHITSPSGQAQRIAHLRQTTTVCSFRWIRLRQGSYSKSPSIELNIEVLTVEVLKKETTRMRLQRHLDDHKTRITPVKASNTPEIEHNPYSAPPEHFPTSPQIGPANPLTPPTPEPQFIFLKNLLLSSKKSCGGVVAITSRDSLARGKGYQEGRRFESCPRSYLVCG